MHRGPCCGNTLRGIMPYRVSALSIKPVQKCSNMGTPPHNALVTPDTSAQLLACLRKADPRDEFAPPCLAPMPQPTKFNSPALHSQTRWTPPGRPSVLVSMIWHPGRTKNVHMQVLQRDAQPLWPIGTHKQCVLSQLTYANLALSLIVLH